MKRLFTLIFFCCACTLSLLAYAEDEQGYSKKLGQFKDKFVELFTPEKPYQADPNKNPKLIIKNGVITYNGEILKLGAPASDWFKVLGKPSRGEPNATYTWDDLGIRIHERENTISSVEVSLLIGSYKDSLIPRHENVIPYQPYTGYIEIEGAGFDSQSSVADINQLINPPHRFEKDYLPIKFSLGGGRIYYMLTTDEKKYYGKIKSFSINTNPFLKK